MNEYIIKSNGFQDEIISANYAITAKWKYGKKYPKREITQIIKNNEF